MELFARAADCISIGDMVDQQIRANSAWSLLPTQVLEYLLNCLQNLKNLPRISQKFLLKYSRIISKIAR